MKYFAAILMVLAIFTCSGCVTQSSHTEGDREVNDQTMKAGEVVVGAAAGAQAAIEAGDLKKARSLMAQAAIAGTEIVKNAKQQEGVHGAAENPAPVFSPENSEKARQKSSDDHASGKWVGPTLTVLGALGGIAAAVCGMPWLAQLFPALTGKIGKMAKAYIETTNSVRAVAEANDGQVDLKTFLEIAKDKNVSHGIQDIVALHAHAHEEAAGMNLTGLNEIKMADEGVSTNAEQEPATKTA